MKTVSKIRLCILYEKQKLSTYKIARLFSCSGETIRRYLRIYNINVRTSSEAHKRLSSAFKGKHHTKEAKDKIRKSRLGKYKGEKAGNYKDGRSLKKYFCIDCSEEIGWNSWWYGGKRCFKCANKNNGEKRKGKKRPEHSKKISGNNNPNWQDGINEEGYSFKFTIELKEQIRQRDNRKCQLCGCPEVECLKKLDVHHIDYNKQNCDENNLISLCHKCNLKVNFNRNYWYAYFMYIIKDKGTKNK